MTTKPRSYRVNENLFRNETISKKESSSPEFQVYRSRSVPEKLPVPNKLTWEEMDPHQCTQIT